MNNVEEICQSLCSFKGRLEDVELGSQNSAFKLCKILVSNYLEDKIPETRDEKIACVYKYPDIQTLAYAILDYEHETQNKLDELVDSIVDIIKEVQAA